MNHKDCELFILKALSQLNPEQLVHLKKVLCAKITTISERDDNFTPIKLQTSKLQSHGKIFKAPSTRIFLERKYRILSPRGVIRYTGKNNSNLYSKIRNELKLKSGYGSTDTITESKEKNITTKSNVKNSASSLPEYLYKAFISAIADRGADEINTCPDCGSTDTVKNGKNRLKKQCYICKNCSRNYCDSTSTALSYTKKSFDKWVSYLECMREGLSIRKSAEKVGLSINTSFQWRHKILNLLKNSLPDKLEGIVEMDEIKIAESYKGNHSLSGNFAIPRQSRKRGLRSGEEFITDRINVLCCTDRVGGIFSEVTGKVKASAATLYTMLSDRILKGATICTNNNAAFTALANKLKLSHYKLTRKDPVIKEMYHTINARAFGSNFQLFLLRFNGVATKYLNNYLTWYKWLCTIA